MLLTSEDRQRLRATYIILALTATGWAFALTGRSVAGTPSYESPRAQHVASLVVTGSPQ